MNKEIDKILDNNSQNNFSQIDNADIKRLLEKNFEMTEEVYKLVKKIDKYLFWQRIFGFLKLIIIVVPIVLSIIYLPPLLKEAFKQYQDLLSGVNTGIPDVQNIDPKNILDLLK